LRYELLYHGFSTFRFARAFALRTLADAAALGVASARGVNREVGAALMALRISGAEHLGNGVFADQQVQTSLRATQRVCSLEIAFSASPTKSDNSLSVPMWGSSARASAMSLAATE
jgi:hypothetical protein